jgi:hypothetical protein
MGKRCFPPRAIPTIVHVRELRAIHRNQSFEIIPNTPLKLGLYTIETEKLSIILGS